MQFLLKTVKLEFTTNGRKWCQFSWLFENTGGKKVLFQKFVFNFITTRFFKLYFGFSCLFENTERKLVFVNNIFHFYYDDV